LVGVAWHQDALTDLDEIAKFIAREAPAFGRLFARRVFDATRRLSDFPRSGRVIAELGREDVREILVGNYRVIYHILPDEVEVVAVIHGARLLAAGSLPLEAPND